VHSGVFVKLRKDIVLIQKSEFWIFRFWRNGIIARPAPRVATGNAFCGQPSAFQQSVCLQCFHGIMRTRGRISTRGWRKWGDEFLVSFYQYYKRICNNFSHKYSPFEGGKGDVLI